MYELKFPSCEKNITGSLYRYELQGIKRGTHLVKTPCDTTTGQPSLEVTFSIKADLGEQ